ncbi:MAG: MgtC/SapB family protein [Gammaproteobacteria bacterium]|jgi:putative Mg2+ transporter-C (MgtC) family protein|nr:MgtC/SapB family protein [Gammaproteobacteria bacterium]
MSVWNEVGTALASEFAAPDAGTMTVIVSRVLCAAVLGGIIGWEREAKGRSAGLRTHMLVSIGAALFMLAPLLADIEGEAVTRVMQGIVQGIGFLGAGAILRRERGGRVEGLTTAAGIWMTAAIGMAAGMGQEMVALVTTLVALVVFAVLPRLEKSSVLAGEPGEGN